MTQSIQQQGIEPDFWSALWLSRLVCQRQMLIVRLGVRILDVRYLELKYGFQAMLIEYHRFTNKLVHYAARHQVLSIT